MSTPRQEDFELLPDLQRWNGGSGISIEDWIGCVGNFEHAIGYSRLFWPQFIELEGCIVWADMDVPKFQQWEKYFHGDLQAVERMVNHRHIADLFGHNERSPTRIQLRYLGRLLRKIWQVKLDLDFPDRHLRVVFNDFEEGDLLDYQITFYQEPEPPPTAPLPSA